jgi:hypothetical protein
VSKGDPPSVGAKDLRDLKGVWRSVGIALLQRQNVPSKPRSQDQMDAPEEAADTAGRAAFQALKQFSPGDYVKWFSEYLTYRFGFRHPFATYAGKQPADGMYPLEGDGGAITIGIAGDWGTGTDEAHRVAKLIGEAAPDYTIHLGDVYFVGDPAEVRENFLGEARKGYGYTPCAWPLGRKASFALNGNHEMYARGIGYFRDILPAMGPMVDGKAQGQPASFFCLKNDDWCVLGLDTGYNSVRWPLLEYVWSPDAALPDAIVTWLQAIAPQIEQQAVIILTHHQVLSVYDDCFTKQADQIFAILKRPVLWLWGHEHRLVVYEPFDGRARGWPVITGRCIGHGGMPVDLPGTHKAGSIGKAALVDRRRYRNDEKLHVGVNGFVRLTLKGAALGIDYVDLYGDTVYTERFRAEAGAVVAAGAENFALSAGHGAPVQDPAGDTTTQGN